MMKDLDFNGKELDGENLADVQYRNQKVEDCGFRSLEMKNCDFSNTGFLETLFEHVTASGTKFDNCKFESDQMEYDGNEFENCSLKQASVKYLSVRDGAFRSCDMEGFQVNLAEFGGYIFENNNMKGLEMDESGIWGDRIVSNDVRNARLLQGGFYHIGEMKGNDFRGSHTEGFSWADCICTAENYSDCSILHATNENTAFTNCTFANAKIAKSYFTDVSFNHCEMENTALSDVEFENCTFRDMDLTKITYEKLLFKKCKFENVKLTEEQERAFANEVKQITHDYGRLFGKLMGCRWFENCGIRDNAFDGLDCAWAEDMADAVKRIESLKLDSVLFDVQYDMRTSLEVDCPDRLDMEDGQRKFIEEKYMPKIRQKVKKAAEAHSLPEKFVSHTVWIVAELFLYDFYADYNKSEFFGIMLDTFLSGHLPCGVMGKKQKMKLVMY